MKTIIEAAQEFGEKPSFIEKGIEIQTMAGFYAGVEFAQRWIPVEEELPEMSDNEEDWIFDDEFDDEPIKFSKDVLIKDKYGNVAMGCMYEDGDWLSEYIIMDKPITHWRPIEIK